MTKDVLIGIDAGTSVIKAVAFDLAGGQIAVASVPNRYETRADGAAVQDMARTWTDTAATLRALGEKVPGLAQRTAGLGVTGQGDGTWLVGAGDRPMAEAWLWLDARAAPTVRRLVAGPAERDRFAATGTVLNVCQMGAQMAHMEATTPELLDRAEAAMHAQDWLYLNLTGVRATEPAEAAFTFGDYRTRQYDDRAIGALGLSRRRHLLPEILDGSEVAHPLTGQAAAETGLLAGTPVSLGYFDIACSAMGAGIYTPGTPAACTIIGSTGVHMRATPVDRVRLPESGMGWVAALPVPGLVAQLQSNMAATLNIDWVLSVAGDLLAEMGQPVSRNDLVARIDGWMAATRPGALVYHPYISDAGERGPFVNPDARASLMGLSMGHRFPDLVRAVIEGLGLAARDCYGAMGPMPPELRLTGGAARSRALRDVLGAAVNAPLRVSGREEAGAAGAAMMAAVAVGAYPDMDACLSEWVVPLLGSPEPPDSSLVGTYDQLYAAYRAAREALPPVWDLLAQAREPNRMGEAA